MAREEWLVVCWLNGVLPSPVVVADTDFEIGCLPADFDGIVAVDGAACGFYALVAKTGFAVATPVAAIVAVIGSCSHWTGQ